MEVKVKRKTGLLGGITKIALRVDGKEVRKLEEDEQYVIQTGKKQITLQARSGFMKSKKTKSSTNETVLIKVNPVCLLFFVLSLVFIFTATFFDAREIKLVFSLVGLLIIISTILYSSRAWFILKKK